MDNHEVSLRRDLWISFFIIILSSIVYLLISNSKFVIISPDGELYQNLAKNFLNGDGLTNTIRKENIVVAPLFPLIISIVLFFFNNISYMILFQFLVLGLIGVYTYLVAYQLFEKKWISFTAVLLLSLNPVLLINGPNHLLTETIYTLFIVIIAYYGILILKNFMSKNYKLLLRNLFIFQFIFTLNLLLRPHLQFLMIIIFIFLVYLFIKKIISLKWITVLLLIPIILTGINIIYNYIKYDELIMYENYSGQNLYIANNPNTKVGFYASTQLENFVDDFYYEVKDLDLMEKSKILKEEAIKYMLKTPLETIERLFEKGILFFKGLNHFDTMVVLLFVFGAITTLIYEKHNRIILLVLLLYILYYVVLSSVGLLVSSQRYRLPIIPIYTILSSYFIYFLKEFYNRHIKKVGNMS